MRWCENLTKYLSNGSDYIFEGVKTTDIRDFLGEAMKDLTPKKFRTFVATHEFGESLNEMCITKKSSDSEKKMALLTANAKVAELLNHQKKIAKGWQDTYEKRKARLAALKKEKGKNVKARREKLAMSLEKLSLTKTWNLGTSLKSYIDPRVSVAFCHAVNYDWREYYPKKLAEKFAWAEE